MLVRSLLLYVSVANAAMEQPILFTSAVVAAAALAPYLAVALALYALAQQLQNTARAAPQQDIQSYSL